MLLLRKIFKLPNPVQLGWSDSNFLEDEEWSDNPKGKTWQDWHRTVKKMHPVKYFITETFGDFLRYKIWLRLTRPFKDFHYWFVSNLIPSRRYHMLDLRQPCSKNKNSNRDCYQYGWRDVPEKMLYAMFNLLGEYLNEEPHDVADWSTPEEISNYAGLKEQQNNLIEARAIYHWWTVERHEERSRYYDMLNAWSNARKTKDPKKEEYWKQMRKLDDDFEAKTDEMILRLMKIRRTLWT
jgi:hypothetical protein